MREPRWDLCGSTRAHRCCLWDTGVSGVDRIDCESNRGVGRVTRCSSTEARSRMALCLDRLRQCPRLLPRFSPESTRAREQRRVGAVHFHNNTSRVSSLQQINMNIAHTTTPITQDKHHHDCALSHSTRTSLHACPMPFITTRPNHHVKDIVGCARLPFPFTALERRLGFAH